VSTLDMIHSPTQRSCNRGLIVAATGHKASNVDVFTNMRSNAKGNRAVGVCLFNGERSSAGGKKFVTCTECTSFQHALIDSKFMMLSLGVGLKQMFVNALLANALKGDNISNERCVEKHAASKDQASRGAVVQR